MSMSSKFFNQSASHENTIEALCNQLTIARRETTPDQELIASLKTQIKDLEIQAAKNGNSVSIEFRTGK